MSATPAPASLLNAHKEGYSFAEFSRLQQPLPWYSPKRWQFALTKTMMQAVGGKLSDGVKLGWDTGFDSGSTLDYVYRNEAEEVFKPIRAVFMQRGIAASFVNLVGPVAESIARRAERDSYDLLVMGSHGHGSLANLVMGSVVTKVLACCKVPVLLIR